MPSYSIPAGELDQRVTLQQRDTALDALGQAPTTWADVATVWARVRPLGGRDFTAAGQDQASAAIRVEIRAGTSVLSTMRVQWDGKPWDIVGEPLSIDRKFIRFDAASGVRDGR